MHDRWLTYQQAARRAGRDVRTIKRWKAQGMPHRLREGRVEVHSDVIAQWKRRGDFLNPAPRKGAA